MTVSKSIMSQLEDSFEANDFVLFRQLLEKHPQYLLDHDGTDYWMAKSALNDKLPFLKAVVELGVDVNHPRDSFQDDFYQPEGPILWAAAQGRLEMVQWLLDHGAKINYMVKDKERCVPLIFAASNGHFDIVKLLVERGANIHGTFQGGTAADQAKDYGHTEIYEYLIEQMQKTKPDSSS